MVAKKKAVKKTENVDSVGSAVENTKKSPDFLPRFYVDEAIPEGQRGRLKPLVHEIPVSEGIIEVACRKTRKGDYQWNMYFDSPRGRVKVTLGASTKKLGRPWMSSPKIVSSSGEAMRMKH